MVTILGHPMDNLLPLFSYTTARVKHVPCVFCVVLRCVLCPGPEPDQFSMTVCPDLLRTGGFRAIASLWTKQLPVRGRGLGTLVRQLEFTVPPASCKLLEIPV